MFQVEKVNNCKDSKYNMSICSDIIYDLNIDLLFSEELITWGSLQNSFNYNSIQMIELGVMSDPEVCSIT